MPLLGQPFICASFFDGLFWWKDYATDGGGANWQRSNLAGTALAAPHLVTAYGLPSSGTLDGRPIAVFDGVDDCLVDTTITTSSLFNSANEFSFSFLLRVDAAPTNEADDSASNSTIYALFTTFGPGPFRITTRTVPGVFPLPDTHYVIVGVNDGPPGSPSWKTARVAVDLATWIVVEVRAYGGTLGIRVNGGAWVTVAFAGIGGGFTNALASMFGGNEPISGPRPVFTGAMAQILVTGNALVDPLLDEFRDYLNDTYPSISV